MCYMYDSIFKFAYKQTTQTHTLCASPPQNTHKNRCDVRSDDLALVTDGLAERVAHDDLDEVLQLRVDVAADGLHELALHAQHQQLQALDHRDHLRDAELLGAAVVVARRLR